MITLNGSQWNVVLSSTSDALAEVIRREDALAVPRKQRIRPCILLRQLWGI
jgi:hypothetical protein